MPSKLIDSKPVDKDTDNKRMVAILLSYIFNVNCKFCAIKLVTNKFFLKLSKCEWIFSVVISAMARFMLLLIQDGLLQKFFYLNRFKTVY